ncbi:MAG: twin-arginine translocase subunit TatC [Fimbriimonadaceae bacterium]
MAKTPWWKVKRNSSGDPEEFRATLVEHLEELRDRIMRSAFALMLGWVAGWFLEPFAYKFLSDMAMKAIRDKIPPTSKVIIAFPTVTEPFMLQIKLAFGIGLILVFPFLILQLWGFIAPGLKPTERRPFLRLAPFSAFLFAMGVAFCWVILPAALGWFTEYLKNFQGAELIQDPAVLIFFCVKLLLAFGVGFQLPLVVWVLGALNLLSAETLLKYWRQSATGIFIFAAVVTPSNDAFSMLMMAIPLTILFIISVYVVKFTQRKQQKARGKTEAATSPTTPRQTISQDDAETEVEPDLE